MPPKLALALCVSTVAALAALPSTAPAGAIGVVAFYRDQGPPGLARLIGERAKASGDVADLDRLIDAVAAQRYASVSGLYWYTDLAKAEAAARAQGKPILSLRMLGRLDEDLSCANSRMFRATLYANRDVSAFLRASFILYWSTERPVPRVTIDYGEGHRIETTVTGNSAHYVLAADGTVLDVLPGLYAPQAFIQELTKSLRLAATVRSLTGAKRRAAIVDFHQGRLAWGKETFIASADTVAKASIVVKTQAAAAQRATMAKAYVEVPTLKKIAQSVDAGAISPDETAVWTEIGRQTWPAKQLLDAQSRRLVTSLHGDGALAMIPRLEDHIYADTAINDLQLRPQIEARLIAHDEPFEALNDWIYATVFHTPKTDPWVGLLPRTDFTGLPGDGAVAP